MLSTSLLYPESARAQLIEALANLPDFLRPTHVGIGENGPFTAIENEVWLQLYAETKSSGFFLRSKNALYDLISSIGKPIRINCFMHTSISANINFMRHMANAGPIFGYCCNEEERNRKNRLIVQLGANTIENWVGRDTSKYVPGLYWITLISTTLLMEHNISIKAIALLAEEHITIEGSQHLFASIKLPMNGFLRTEKSSCTRLSQPYSISKKSARKRLA